MFLAWFVAIWSSWGQLVSYWPLDGDLRDVADAGMDQDEGTIVGSETFGEGRMGKALYLDGASHVAISPSKDLELTGATSVALWFRIGFWDKRGQTLFAGGLGSRFHLQRVGRSGALGFGEVTTQVLVGID